MAADPTPPRNGLIVIIALASLVTLVTLKFVFDWYYYEMMEAELAAKSMAPEELKAARAADQQKLGSGPLPIEKAMAGLAKGRDTLISPEVSADEGPLVGWSKTPRTVPTPAVMPATGDAGAVTDGSAPLATDASTLAAGDAAVLAPAAKDAAAPGAPAPVPPAPQKDAAAPH